MQGCLQLHVNEMQLYKIMVARTHDVLSCRA